MTLVMTAPPRTTPPTVGILPDLVDGRVRVKREYAAALRRAGGRPVVLSPPSEADDIPSVIEECLALCGAFVFTGGDDPRTEPFGQPTDPRTTPVDPQRQAFETALLRALFERAGTPSERPTLGVCLGMQMMALVAGGALDQWMPDSTPTHTEHWSDTPHEIVPEHAHSGAPAPSEGGAAGSPLIWSGRVTSHHRQAVRDPGQLAVRARAHDGIIEAIELEGARCMLGVQWHPERTPEHALGDALFAHLVRACS